ncbi:hypothetical protein [Nonomuraea rhizosphaerae]|uniref:hypothetical protein n=1 Tax=Nonomuraea rhizosphaerae TaxID=2665663 RepID=UPI001C5F9A9C|nr:hypothetical protein [Nonomuraea rhizosphaerae]
MDSQSQLQTEVITHGLELVSLADESRLPCRVTTQILGEVCELRLDWTGVSPIILRSSVDFEDTLRELRATLEQQGFLLLCNRFRRNAFVSSMSRQMSDGLGCYLVTAHRPVSPDQIVNCLAPAPRESVVLAEENAKYIEEWIAGFD